MKWLGMILILLAAAETGFYAAGQLRAQVKQLQIMRQMLLAMMAELKHKLPLIPDLLRTLAAEQDFKCLRFLQAAAQNAESFPECWSEAVEQDSSLPENVRSILQTVGNTLGSTALEGQLTALELCAEQLKTMQDAMAEQVGQRGRLYQSFGVLGGMFLVILFL